jgi:hypothetical protein
VTELLDERVEGKLHLLLVLPTEDYVQEHLYIQCQAADQFYTCARLHGGMFAEIDSIGINKNVQIDCGGR